MRPPPLLNAVVTMLATVFRVLHFESPKDVKICSLINWSNSCCNLKSLKSTNSLFTRGNCPRDSSSTIYQLPPLHTLVHSQLALKLTTDNEANQGVFLILRIADKKTSAIATKTKE